MREILNINKNWLFIKNTTDINASEGVEINLPHTWNTEDGYDGGNDYFRGSSLYLKTLIKSELPETDLGEYDGPGRIGNGVPGEDQ